MVNVYSNLEKDFVILDNILEFPQLKSQFKLYVIKTDFNRSDLELIKRYKLENPKVDFWISSEIVTRERVLLANQIGVENVIEDPFDIKIIEELFSREEIAKLGQIQYDNSLIEGSRVVVVDDNALNIELLIQVLLPFKIELYTFLEPRKALEFSMQNKIDLFLLDVMMPDMSGFELAQSLQHSNSGSKIIFVSALSESHNKVEGYNLGSCAYIEKPFDVSIVRSQIFSILKAKKQGDLNKSTKDNFVAMITHDLKTPISAKTLALEMLLKDRFGRLTQEQAEIVQDILNSTKYMQNITENLLSKYKFESGTVSLKKEKICFIVFIQQCLEDLKYIFEERAQKIKLEVGEIDSIVSVDLLQMKRVLHNLLSNSSEHAPKGSEIVIKTSQTPSSLEFSITDFGDGIPFENPNDVFEKYLSASTKDKVSSGLGLFICKEIVTAHGGKIFAESELGKGATFVVNLPIFED